MSQNGGQSPSGDDAWHTAVHFPLDRGAAFQACAVGRLSSSAPVRVTTYDLCDGPSSPGAVLWPLFTLWMYPAVGTCGHVTWEKETAGSQRFPGFYASTPKCMPFFPWRDRSAIKHFSRKCEADRQGGVISYLVGAGHLPEQADVTFIFHLDTEHLLAERGREDLK